jgi:Exonuclease VII small subunit.
MSEKKFNYEEAVTQLETLVRMMERGELDFDSLCDQLKTVKATDRELQGRCSRRPTP